jgi:hypothetical protein
LFRIVVSQQASRSIMLFAAIGLRDDNEPSIFYCYLPKIITRSAMHGIEMRNHLPMMKMWLGQSKGWQVADP